MRRLSTVLIVAFSVLLAMPALAADRIITNGIDLWATSGDGSTFSDFAKTPIPAGFFCPSSEPFTGRIAFKGVPIATGQPGALGNADTIVQRLDNAVFNKRGVATTRLQMRAMQFESISPVKTSCGDYKAYVTLDGEQPVTTMRIVRTSEKGGRFFAPIAVNVKITFTPAGRMGGEVLELRQTVRLSSSPDSRWTESREGTVKHPGFVAVDTDGDGASDTFLPGTSNFAAGASPRTKAAMAQQPVAPAPNCHPGGGSHQHCTYVAAIE
jgi:hypothetical protein